MSSTAKSRNDVDLTALRRSLDAAVTKFKRQGVIEIHGQRAAPKTMFAERKPRGLPHRAKRQVDNSPKFGTFCLSADPKSSSPKL